MLFIFFQCFCYSNIVLYLQFIYAFVLLNKYQITKHILRSNTKIQLNIFNLYADAVIAKSLQPVVVIRSTKYLDPGGPADILLVQ